MDQPIEVSSENHTPPLSRERTPRSQRATGSSVLVLVAGSSVLDSAAAAVCMSAKTDMPDAEENFVLACTETAVLLAGGRNELNLKDKKWFDSKGKQSLFEDIIKGRDNILNAKKALRPISRSESQRIRAQHPDRIVPSKLVLTEKVGRMVLAL